MIKWEFLVANVHGLGNSEFSAELQRAAVSTAVWNLKQTEGIPVEEPEVAHLQVWDHQ